MSREEIIARLHKHGEVVNSYFGELEMPVSKETSEKWGDTDGLKHLWVNLHDIFKAFEDV